jgi:hypothetical protein
MMRTICHANKFAKEASATAIARDLMFAGPHIQIYSTSIRPLFTHVFDGIVWYCTSGDVLYICLSKECFRILLCMMM